MKANNTATNLDILTEIKDIAHNALTELSMGNYPASIIGKIISKCNAALAAPPHTGKWMNGRNYEYEYAYCSECGRMQWADWDTHKQAEESIGSFADDYRFCPGCGAKMEGGVYVK